MGKSWLLAPLSRLRERGWGRGCFDGLPDPFEHIVRPIHYIVIPEAQYRETLRCEPCTTLAIIGDLIAMLAAIDFNDEPMLHANEINNAWAQRFLALELQTEEAMGAKVIPEVLLGRCLGRAHGFGVIEVGHA
jgi:hypothetical protein